MSEIPKPKRQRKAEIIPLPPPPVDLRLGSLAMHDPKEMIARAAEMATSLAEIIHAQRDSEDKPTLYVIIKGKKFVRAEGWTTLGAMLGVVPIEESCDPLPDAKGYKAKVKLVRICDGAQVGGASAICYLQEKGWDNPDAYATHSKAITRATGKAFRLSFAWIMKLAGFEPTPADEIFEVEGSQEDSDEIAKKKIEKHLGQTFTTLPEAEEAAAQAQAAKKEERKTAKVSAFITWPESHNGHKFFLTGRLALMEHGLWNDIKEVCSGTFNERDGGFYLPSDFAPYIRKRCDETKCPLIERQPGDMTPLLKRSVEIESAKREPGDEFEAQVPL